MSINPALYNIVRKIEERVVKDIEENKKRERQIEDCVNWLEFKQVGGVCLLTLWGASLKVSSLVGKSGREARIDALDLRLSKIKKAIKDGQLDAIDKGSLEVERTAYNNDDFIEESKFNDWLSLSYSHLFQDTKTDCEDNELVEEPIPLSGHPETQIEWMLYILRVKEKQSPNSPIRRGLLIEVINIAGSLKHPIGESTIKRNWGKALKRFQSDTD